MTTKLSGKIGGMPVSLDRPKPVLQDGKWWEFITPVNPKEGDYYLRDGEKSVGLAASDWNSSELRWLASPIPQPAYVPIYSSSNPVASDSLCYNKLCTDCCSKDCITGFVAKQPAPVGVCLCGECRLEATCGHEPSPEAFTVEQIEQIKRWLDSRTYPGQDLSRYRIDFNRALHIVIDEINDPTDGINAVTKKEIK